MRNWPERRKRQARIEIIPMIDVMMFLLVFFVLISINVLPSLGLRITPPSSARTENLPDRKKVMLSISKDGAVFVDGVAVDLASLADRLRDAETQAKAANQTLVVAIAGDEEASLQHLVDVLVASTINPAVMAMATAAGRFSRHSNAMSRRPVIYLGFATIAELVTPAAFIASSTSTRCCSEASSSPAIATTRV